MRLYQTILSMLAVAAIGLAGCAMPALSRLRTPDSSTASAVAPSQPRLQRTTPNIAQVSHIEETTMESAACPGTCPADASADMPCISNGLPNDAPGDYNGSCFGAGSGGCQSCNAQPYGYAPYPDGYFNPTLIEPNEFICDGGDNTPHARARVGDQIVGVEMEDTVVRYSTDAGDVHVQPSNKVCVYAPRFASVRKVTAAESGELAVGPVGILRPEGPDRAQVNQPGLAVTGRSELRRGSAVRGPDAMRARDRSVPVERVLQPELAEDVLTVLSNLSLVNYGILRDTDKPWLSMAAISAITWSVDTEVGVTVNSLAPVTLTRDLRAEELVVYDFPNAGRLRIGKLADKSDALPGDTVTFIIRVDNVGDSTVHDIIITDSLVTRLEYTVDSQKCTTDAKFTTEENDGQSLRLTWKLAKELKVGEGATIEFKCKVR